MRVLLTGASGFIGRATATALRAAGHEVVPDLADAPGAAVLLGWPGGPGRMRDEAANVAAAAATVDTARALVEQGCARVVVSGSCVEDLPGHPVGQLPYARAKREVHAALATLPGTTCAHVHGVTGPWEPPGRVVPQIVQALLEGRPVDVSDATQRRDVLHVADVGDGLVATLAPEAPRTLDVCRGHAPPLRELFAALEAETGTRGLVRYGAARIDDAERYDAVGDPTALRRLGWAPAHPPRATAAAAVAWWRDRA